MSDNFPDHRHARWDPQLLAATEQELLSLAPYVVISGGWAWHYFTPPGHAEYQLAHDHKDADLFVSPSHVAPLLALLAARGFEQTKSPAKDQSFASTFTHFTRSVPIAGGTVQVLLNLIVADVPHVQARRFRVVDPLFLLEKYPPEGADECFSVRIGRQLARRGVAIPDHPELAVFDPFLP